jgi:DNA-binding transcriptional regulator YhcF (GntR family)
MRKHGFSNWGISMDDVLKIYESVLRLIVKGSYSVGTMLPSVKLMAATESVEREDVRKAYRRLESEGYADSSPVAGYIVRATTKEDATFFIRLKSNLEAEPESHSEAEVKRKTKRQKRT